MSNQLIPLDIRSPSDMDYALTNMIIGKVLNNREKHGLEPMEVEALERFASSKYFRHYGAVIVYGGRKLMLQYCVNYHDKNEVISIFDDEQDEAHQSAAKQAIAKLISKGILETKAFEVTEGDTKYYLEFLCLKGEQE